MADLSAVPWDQFPLDAKPDDLVSPHFKFSELTKSEIASRQRLNNAFPAGVICHAAVYLCRTVLEPIRARFGAILPNSIFRSQEVERALKKKPKTWVSTSQHTLGQACDVEAANLPNMKLARWIAQNLPFDQIILECYNANEGANSGWVHVSIMPPSMRRNRGILLSYVMNPRAGKYVYVSGLRETV